MAFTYTVVIQETEPTQISPASFWIKPSQGILTIYYQDGVFHHLAAGNGNLVASDGTFFRTVSEGTTPPVSPSIGDLWLQTDQNTYWAWLGRWCPIGGG
ncbi:MAG: hypothetical protein OQK32_06180 [Gammaproteobacteria bacterium]|nr:hypothetical protein [Gammaproteobacteria bacterium]MCW8924453.1 hypothetical protein [Gammaproteobacteria bacterium]